VEGTSEYVWCDAENVYEDGEDEKKEFEPMNSMTKAGSRPFRISWSQLNSKLESGNIVAVVDESVEVVRRD
jgi:hypothetical protein